MKRLPAHEFLQEWGEFVSHLFVLTHGGMPVSAIAEAAIVGREVETIDLGVALLMGIVKGGV